MSVQSLTKKILQNMLQRKVNAGGLRVGGKKRKPKTKTVAKKKKVKRAGMTVGGKKKKGPKKGGAVPSALKPWHSFLMKFRRAHPNMEMKEAMHRAGIAYRR